MADPIHIVLETDRLILRRQQLTDLDDLYPIYQDPDVRRYIPDYPRTYEDTREEVAWFVDGHPRHPELGLWATIHKETGRYIGRSGLLPWSIEGVEEVEVAYLLSQEFWGKRLATEAAQAIAHYGFDALNLPRLISLIDPENTASAHVARKIGMSLEKNPPMSMGCPRSTP